MKNARELLEDFTGASFRDPKKAAEMFTEAGAFEIPYLESVGVRGRYEGREGSRRRHDMATGIAEPTRELLYLEDLHVGRRFTSGTHALDERQMIAFASEFDPQPFHTNREPRGRPFSGGPRRADGTRRRSPCASRSTAACRSLAASSASGGSRLADGDAARKSSPRRERDRESRTVSLAADRGTVTVRSEARNQRGEVVQRATVRLLVPRRSKLG